MPRIPIYESQVSPTAQIPFTPASAANGDGGLVALGEGLAQLGQNVYRRQYEQDDADSVEATAKLRTALAERRQQAAIDGTAADPEWVAKEREWAEEQIAQVAGNLRTADGKKRASTRGALALHQETEQALLVQAKTVAALQKNKLQAAEDLALRAIQADPASRAVAVENFLADLEGPAYSRLPADMKEEYTRQFRYKAAREFLNGTEMKFGAAAALEELDSVRDEMPAEQFAALRDHFTTRVKAEKAKNKEVEQLAAFRRIDDLIRDGGNPKALIDTAVKKEVLSAEQGFALEKQWVKYVELQRKVAEAGAAWRAGDRAMFDRVKPSIREEAINRWMAEKNAELDNAAPEQRPRIAHEIARKGVEMDYVFPALKARLETPPHGPGFAAAVDLYRSLDAYDRYYASQYVDAAQRARFDIYVDAVAGGADDKTAMELARTVTPEAIAKTRKLLQSQDGKNVRAIVEDALSDRPGWFTGDMLNGREATDAVMEGIAARLAGNPAADINKVAEAAVKAYEDAHLRVGNLWVPRAAVRGIPADEMLPVVERVQRGIPDVLRELKFPVVEGEYRVAPDRLSSRDGKLQVFDPEGLPIPGFRLGAADFQREYREQKAKEYSDAVAARSSGGVTPEEYKRRTGFYPPGYQP